MNTVMTKRAGLFCQGPSFLFAIVPLPPPSIQHNTKSTPHSLEDTLGKQEREREMDSEAEQSPIPKLPLLSIQLLQSPDRSGMLTPPLHTSASVPFRWEEEPGKPRPCTAITTFTNPTDFAHKCLELPPRLLIDANSTKLPSPTTVLEGPYMGRSQSQTSSFRIRKETNGSFSHERVQLGAIVLSQGGLKERGWFGAWRRRALKGKREVNGASYIFPSSVDREGDCGSFAFRDSHTRVKMTKIKRTGSFTSLSHLKSHFWVSFKLYLLFQFHCNLSTGR
ncbi:DUF688 domain-containing protein [Quillaja saponaria]|uniref:DUF688 domain-containing protein n=1 Tax=Quillaja saponaria TaxID=32244 RepID=A0AAD7L4R9_QUISA|nr:DUF688 domain-containing protein [Quillaja saponaria]